MRKTWLVVSLVGLVACGGDEPLDPPEDSGGDSSARDAADSGADTGVDAGTLRCTASEEELFAAEVPSGAAAGDWIGCAVRARVSMEALQDAIDETGVEALGGYTSTLFAYVTQRDDTTMGVGTAELFEPDAAVEGIPLVVAAHGTIGHSDDCAPSRLEPNKTLVLPWVAVGMPIVAVDYAGLGTPGVQGYGDAYDTAQSLIDGARAGQAQRGQESRIVFVGHSQGGGAVHFAQGLVSDYAPELEVEAAIAFAGGPSAPPRLTSRSAGLVGRVPLTVTGRALCRSTPISRMASGSNGRPMSFIPTCGTTSSRRSRASASGAWCASWPA